MNISKTILVTRHLPAMKAFYINQIGFPLVSETNESFTMQIGTDQLTYQQTD
ncbi:MAG TPA: glyoxalase, partial [Exiguobacterium sp.]|nr:glyoxalase [Exiguobacterium sp.]